VGSRSPDRRRASGDHRYRRHLVTAHSDKELAAPTFKRGYGFHPLCAFADHGPAGTGDQLAMLLCPGNAGANAAADHKTVLAHALAQVPDASGYRVGRKVLIRADAGGGTHEFLDHLTARRPAYSVGFGRTETMVTQLALIPATAWTPAYDSDGAVREGAWVAEATGVRLVRMATRDTGHCPQGTPPPRRPAALHRYRRLRLTAFATNTARRQLADLELRHRRRARCEDRIRAAKNTGLQNLPLHGFNQNQIWCAIVQLACDLIAWTQMLALHDHPAQRWEPKRLRLRLFSIADRIS
jgi:hypothetical protein